MYFCIVLITNGKHLQELKPGKLVLLRNSAGDSRKGDKLAKRWLGPYKIYEHIDKGVYCLENPSLLVELSRRHLICAGMY